MLSPGKMPLIVQVELKHEIDLTSDLRIMNCHTLPLVLTAACPRWNCACDKHIRADRAFANVIAAVFVIDEQAYFLPLAASGDENNHLGFYCHCCPSS